MRIYTKTGDKGTTSLFSQERVRKDDLRVEAYGTIDELNSVIGICLHYVDEQMKEWLLDIQNKLFIVGGHFASKSKEYPVVLEDEYIEELEKIVDELKSREGFLKNFKGFVLPGSKKPAAFLHLARTVCRRAERRAITVSAVEKVNENCIKYLNRLSDALFSMAVTYEDEPNYYYRPKKK